MPNIPQQQDDNGGNGELSKAVEDVLAAKNWSLRRASIASGIPYSTIERMKRGGNVESDRIARFAFKIAEPGRQFETVVRWLRIAKKDDLVAILVAIGRASSEIGDDVATHRVEVSEGQQTYVLPSGLEIEASRENISVLEAIFGVLERAKIETRAGSE